MVFIHSVIQFNLSIYGLAPLWNTCVGDRQHKLMVVLIMGPIN